MGWILVTSLKRIVAVKMMLYLFRLHKESIHMSMFKQVRVSSASRVNDKCYVNELIAELSVHVMPSHKRGQKFLILKHFWMVLVPTHCCFGWWHDINNGEPVSIILEKRDSVNMCEGSSPLTPYYPSWTYHLSWAYIIWLIPPSELISSANPNGQSSLVTIISSSLTQGSSSVQLASLPDAVGTPQLDLWG